MTCRMGMDNIFFDNSLYRLVYDGVGTVLPCWLSYFVAGLVIMLILVNGLLIGSAVFTWGERRLLARLQNRIGPNRWGPFGTFQPLADLVKLLLKEDLMPRGADRIAFTLAPIMMMAPVVLVLAVVPFAKNTVLADLNVGVLYILAVTSLTALAIFMAGWSSNNRFSLFGASRGVAMLISYEIPVVLSLLGVVMVSGSMSLGSIVEAQRIPFLLVQPLALLVFAAGASAEMNRTPFDVAEAESEIVAGYHTEYSGAKFALMQAAEYSAVIVTSAVIATLFLGGWAGPAADYLGWLWFLLKVGVLLFAFTWVRATFPRLRIDQIMAFSWKFLLPLSVINLFATSLEVYFLRDSQGVLSTGDLWLMTAINLGLTVGSIMLFGNLIRDKVGPLRPRPAGTAAPSIPPVSPR